MQESLKQKLYNNRYTLTVMLFIAVGVVVRVAEFGKIPAGFNQDEAFAAYEAFSLLNYGVDSAGNAYPTYFVSWGSGMNVLQSYLAIPFMWLFGAGEAVFRLPSLISAVFTLPVFYLTLKRLFGKLVALIGLGIMAVSPWHIMISRFGLESNLAPAFFLFGFYFLLKGIEKNPYFLLAALFFGLSLYAYSIMWLVVPLVLILFGVYILRHTAKIKIRYVVCACLLLLLFALHHILFLAINLGGIPEIKTSFFAIPKLVAMRGEEVSLLNIFSFNNWVNLFWVLILQYDRIPWNSSPEFGLFYHISLPFLIVGAVMLIRRLFTDIKKKRLSGAYFILSGFLSTVLISLMLFNLNINKSNCMHLFTLCIVAFGVYSVIDFVRHKKTVIISLVVAFAICFTLFCGYYFGGNAVISEGFADGIGESVEFVKNENCQKVAVDRNIFHSHILYYDKTPPMEFKNTVKYEVYPYPYLKATSFGKYTFGIEYNDLGDYDAYIFPIDHLYFFSDEDYNITRFSEYAVAIKKGI